MYTRLVTDIPGTTAASFGENNPHCQQESNLLPTHCTNLMCWWCSFQYNFRSGDRLLWEPSSIAWDPSVCPRALPAARSTDSLRAWLAPELQY